MLTFLHSSQSSERLQEHGAALFELITPKFSRLKVKNEFAAIFLLYFDFARRVVTIIVNDRVPDPNNRNETQL